MVTTYFLKCAIRHLMYSMFGRWPCWCSEQFGETKRPPPSAGSTACCQGCQQPSWVSMGPARGRRAVPPSSQPPFRGHKPQSRQPADCPCLHTQLEHQSWRQRDERDAFPTLVASLCVTQGLVQTSSGSGWGGRSQLQPSGSGGW